MVSKIEVFAVVSVAGLILANAAFAQETGGVPVPERPSEYQLPPSTGGGGGRPGLLVGTGADVQFGGPRYDFTLPTPQPLYRADDQIDGAEDPIEFPLNAEPGDFPDDEAGTDPANEWEDLPGRPDGPPDGSREWLAYFGIDEDALLPPLDGGHARVPPSNGGGGGRPPTNTEMNELPQESGYEYDDPPDYIDDCGHPWHGECPSCSDWYNEQEAARIEQYAAEPAGERRLAENTRDPAPTIPYDTPSFDGFHPDLRFAPRDDADW